MTTDRAENALADVVAVETVAPGMARVVSWSGAYIVDARSKACECKDKQYNLAPDELCKHQIAATLAMRDDIETPGLAVDNLNTRAVADGGERPEDCECRGDEPDDALPCAECWLDGFETPNN